MNEFKFLRKGGEAIHKLGDITRYLYTELIVVTREDDNFRPKKVE